MYKTFTDKTGVEWNIIGHWQDAGVTPGSTGKTTAICPLCSSMRSDANKKQKCMSVNYERKTALCSHCGEKFMILKDDPEWEERNQRHEKKIVYAKPVNNIKHDLPERILSFLYSRKLTDEVIQRNKLGHDVKWFGKTQAEMPCVSIPYFKDGELVGMKYRTNPKDWTADAGTEPIIYGYDDIKGESLIWVEGEFDKLAVEVAGFENCVSVPNGAKSAGCLDNVSHKLKPIRSHIIAVDNDQDGNDLKNDLIRRLNPAKCKIVKFPEGCKDANDVLKEHGPEILKRCIEDAVKVPINGIVKPSALVDKLLEKYRSKDDGGFSTGWDNVDKLYRVKPGQWTVITGIPNHGKSEFLDALMINMITRHQWKFGVFSPENYPLETHLSKMLRKATNKAFGRQYNGTMTEKEALEGVEAFDKYISFVSIDDDTHDIDSLLKITEDLVLSEGINGMIIDPWNTIEHNRPKNLTETEYVSSALSKVTYLARKYDIHIWIVAHPTKMQKLNNGKYGVPLPYDIAGSANWANKSDNAITVYIDKGEGIPDNAVQIHVTKVRFRENGQPGETTLFYNKTSGRYTSE